MRLVQQGYAGEFDAVSTGVGADGATPQETLRHKGPLKLDDLERGGHADETA
jgi:hypothetical protein